jgi:hypothetical protein
MELHFLIMVKRRKEWIILLNMFCSEILGNLFYSLRSVPATLSTSLTLHHGSTRQHLIHQPHDTQGCLGCFQVFHISI